MTQLRQFFACLILLGGGALHAESGLFIITSDFATGSSTYLAANSSEPEIDVLSIHSDAVGHFQNGLIYVVNRLGQDNILLLDPADVRSPLTQYSVGNGTNPQDIEILAVDKAYVTLYESTQMLIIDPRDGTQLGNIDLSAFVDDDGLPEMTQIVRLGERVYVICQRLDRNAGWGPAGISYLAVIDVTTDQLVDVDPATAGIQGIALSAGNPGSISVVGTQLVVSAVANFGDRAGGIDIVDTATNRSLGLRIDEESLGGDIQNLVMVDATRGFAVIADASFVNSVLPVDLGSATVGAPLEGLSGGFIATIAVDGTRLLVGDQGSFSDPASAGLVIFDATTGERLAGPIFTGLPPADIVVLSAIPAVTAVAEQGEAPLPQASRLARAYPNPFNASVQIPFTLTSTPGIGPGIGDADVDLAIYDLLGRRVRTLTVGALGAGFYTQQWDGRNDRGQVVGNGTYLVRLRHADSASQTKIMLLK